MAFDMGDFDTAKDMARWAHRQPNSLEATTAIMLMMLLMFDAAQDCSEAQKRRIERRLDAIPVDMNEDPASVDALIDFNKALCAIMGRPYS